MNSLRIEVEGLEEDTVDFGDEVYDDTVRILQIVVTRYDGNDERQTVLFKMEVEWNELPKMW